MERDTSFTKRKQDSCLFFSAVIVLAGLDSFGGGWEEKGETEHRKESKTLVDTAHGGLYSNQLRAQMASLHSQKKKKMLQSTKLPALQLI